ncbi:MAG: hydrogenase maturation nickel metallochaperone HypA [Phycisphaerae bacterium]|nr:hydrogenase maturation nickel metallochaperone HypA [Tepidisphaeraceae bacterium]
MHETSVVHSLIELIRESLAGGDVARVACVRVNVGPLSGVEPAALRFAWAAVSPEALGPTAELELVTGPVLAWCRACEAEREVASVQRVVCPVCGAPTPDLLTGRELELESIELSTTE